jgi:ankyrin repeat protein
MEKGLNLIRKGIKTMDKRIILILSIFAVIIGIFQLNSKATSKGEYKIIDINIYKDTSVWELALAVKGQNTRKIEKIIKDKPDLINYQEPKYGATLLLWSVGTEKYKSAETLLKCGADPDIASTNNSTYGGETPLFVAAGFSWVDNDAKKDPKYVKLLLNYGANPNINYTGFNIPGEKSVTEIGTSPLMNSIRCGIEKTKALVEAGADINYKTKSGTTVAIKALRAGGSNATLEATKYAHYLIVEKKAKVNEPYYGAENVTMPGDNPNDKFFPVDILRNWVFGLDSKEYKIKMEIVKEFARQGVNYWDTKVNQRTLEHIQKLYPDRWEEYIKKY